MKIFLRLLIFFLILIIGTAGLAFYWTFYKPLPDYEAQLEMEGLQQPVDIHWDDFGVPHIYAQNKQDLYFAMGYVHAQDRLWQMTLSQLLAEGRFAEFFGPDLVELDRYQRTLGFWKMAQRIEKEVISDEERAVLQAYSDGVNHFVEQNGNRLPVQFSLSGIQPMEWTPTRSLAIIRLMGWDLNLSWWTEITYNYLKETLPPQQFEELLLSWDLDFPTTLDAEESAGITTSALIPMLQQELNRRKILEFEGSAVGSNAWVVSGKKTSTGYPLLAGDPHLGLDMPGRWYEVHLSLNGKNVSGVTLAGLPGVVLGQNDHMAWSFTNIMADDTDFYLEQVDPEDLGRYVVDSTSANGIEYAPFNRVREIIKVKDGDEQLVEIRYTGHGPVISDIYPSDALTGNKVISMQWTGYELSNELRTMLGINWAEDFQDFKDVLPHFGVPGQNIMYGDTEGNIGMFSTAKLPIRSGNPITLRAGWDPSTNWNGFIPHEQMPHIINPEEGWIANANNKIATDDYPYYLATFWEPPSRMNTITRSLTAKETFEYEDFAELQNSSYSDFAARMTPMILDVINNQLEYDFSMPVSYLSNWDFRYEPNSTAASIFDAFMLSLTRNTLKDDLGDDAFEQFIVHELVPIRTMMALTQDSSSFFDDITTPETETREEMILKSMQDAIFFLSDSLGSEQYEWRWEQLHSITLSPPLFGMAAQEPGAPKALKLIVDNILSKGPYPAVGHGMSVNNGQYNWKEPYEMTLGASVRRIVDLSDLSATKSILPTGQSGNPLSTHYGDQTELWLNGRYRTFYQDSTFFRSSDYQTMHLVPAD